MTYVDFVEIFSTGIVCGIIISAVPILLGAVINVFFHIVKK